MPRLFKNNKLGILPINRGQYVIGKFELCHEIDNEKIEEQAIDETILIPDNIKSIEFIIKFSIPFSSLWLLYVIFVLL